MASFRNIAIIAHVDHGKTTLVDEMLKQAQIFRENQAVVDRVMDSGDLERERGITILAKNTAVVWKKTKINIVDTPGHADFGGEVERALGMVDGVIVLVDAAEGPMPQTRFVLKKALALGLRPMLVINKIDRKDARPDEVVDLSFDLMVELGATEEQLDFPIIYAIAREGKAWTELEEPKDNLSDLFDLILEHLPEPIVDNEAPFKLQVSNISYSDYLGRIAIGRVLQGTLKKNEQVNHLRQDSSNKLTRITQTYSFMGLEQQPVDEVVAADIVSLSGIENVEIGDTLCHPSIEERMPVITVDEPTVSITVSPNTSPFAGKEGKFVTSRHIINRLEKELLSNVALRVEDLGNESYRVSGRGELHISILLEQMRREGFEFGVSRPQVIIKEEDGVKQEPFEYVVADVPEKSMGNVMESLSSRKGTLINMIQEQGRAKLEFSIPSRGLFGYRSQFLSMTQGEGLLNSIFDGYKPMTGVLKTRQNGSIVSMEQGEAFTYSLFKLQDRGIFFIDPGEVVYVGMVIGEANKAGDINVNVNKNKKLSAVRVKSSDHTNMYLTPTKKLSLEEALEYIEDDELLELTPENIRIRKKELDPTKRARESKKAAAV